MAMETAMRLREMFTLEWSQIDYEQRTIFLSKTKNGDKRQVPMSSVIHQRLKERSTDKGLVFPWWDGSIDTLAKTTARLSHQWARIARDAGCPDLRFHDLRRHAITRLYLETKLSDMEISLISGHKSMKMLRRYSNLRGSDLAKKMW
jgi:integrase